ncbi:MAG: hypothetical protein KF721_15935 [Ignavibacteriaceae bacterium]|nr:hypothetical protein [Ignavibacteriaceae bacterium]
MLKKALSHPKILPKLLLSHNFTQPNTAIFKSLPDSVQGNIAENGQSNFFSEYSIYSNKSPSLALLIAKKITGNRYQPILFDNFVYQKTPQGDVALGLNTFLPKFNYTDPGKLLGEEITLESDSSSFFDIRYNTLGNAVSDIGSEDLKFQLENRKIQGKKNYIFIGAFNSGEDRHDTYYGKLSGPIILINLSYAIIEGQYRFNLLYILFLTISLSYILVILIKLSLGIPLLYPFKEQIEKKLKKEKIAVSKKTATRSVLLAFNDVMKLVFLDELHFWLVVLLVVMTAVIFDKLINGFGLIIVFLILYKVMQLISKHKKS